MDGENFLAFGSPRKIDKEDFIEAAFAEEFGREIRDIVGGSHDEDRGRFFVEPGEESAEDACAGARIAGMIGVACESFVDLIDPKDGRGDGFGDLNGAADVVLGRTDEAAEHFSDIKAKEGHLPEAGDSFGGEAFAAAVDANEENAARRGEAELAGGGREGEGASLEPGLESGESAHVGKGFGGVVVFEESVFVDELAFFLKDVGDFVAGKAFLADEDTGEYVFRFVESKSAGSLQKAFAAEIVEVDFHLLETTDVIHDFIEQVRKFVESG